MLAPSYRISFQCTFIMYLKNQDPMVIGWNRVTLGGVELPWVYPPTHHRSFFAPILCGHGQATQRPDRIFFNSFDAITEVIISKVHFKKWQKIICQKKRHDQYYYKCFTRCCHSLTSQSFFLGDLDLRKMSNQSK